MTDPLVTIVTPSYQQGHFIRATIESVLAQDYPHIEYIVMDGGSTDSTAAVVNEYAHGLTWISEKDRGQSHAINKGFQMARGSIVAWLNSDDVLLPGAVRTAVETLHAHPQAGAMYGEGYTIDKQGNNTGRFPWTEPFNLWKLVYHTDYILQQSVFFRKEVLQELNYLDESLHFGMDWDILIRIGKRYGLAYTPAYLGCLREYAEAKSFSGAGKRFTELAALMRRHGNRKYPPGYIIYGLDTYEKLWSDKIRPWTPSFVPKYLSQTCRLIIDRTMRDAQGIYRDGWAGPTLHWMLPPGSGTVRIQGELPGVPALQNQKLTLLYNGHPNVTRSLETGPLDWTVTLPSYQPNQTADFILRASKFFRPSRADPRRLAWRMISIAWV